MGRHKGPMTTPGRRGPDPALLYPKRADVKWFMRGGVAVLEYPKNFNRFERLLHRLLKGSANIRRPLDEVGTMLWKMSDGDHSLLDIYMAEQEAFKERVEPLDKVVGGLLETLLKLGLMTLHLGKGRGGAPKKKRKGSRIVVRAFK